MDKDLKGLYLSELAPLIAGLGGRPYWRQYIFSFIHQRSATQIDQITPLPRALRHMLVEAGYYISSLQTRQVLVDPDRTCKFVFQTDNGLAVESVVLEDAGRNTACISSQSGCRMGCVFCATGQMGFQGDLTAAQIVDQVYRMTAEGMRIHNVVYMGMGEPFDNYEAVMRSARLLNDKHGLNIGQRRITISTCGIPEGILRFAQEGVQFRLAISLHAADDQLRSRLMPAANRYCLAEILRAAEIYQAKTRRRVTIEYCMIKSVNDSPRDARALVAVLKGLKANVNLIELNPSGATDLAASPKTQVRRFCRILQEANIETSIRFRRGRTIAAACGQLGAAMTGSKGAIKHD